MKKTAALLLPLLSVACSSTPTARSELGMRDVSFAMHDLKFPSGLRVIIEEDHRAPVVTVLDLVGTGSTGDPKGREGLAHFIEHLAFRANPSKEASVWHLLARAGVGEFNAFTGLDETVYHETGPRGSLADLLRIEAIRLTDPTINVTPAVFNVEREVVRNELRQSNETGASGAAEGAIQAELFPPDHPYARSVIGTHESLSAITLDDAHAFAKTNYRADNATIVIVGDVDPEATAKLVEKVLPPALLADSGHKQARAPLPNPAPEPPNPPKVGMGHIESEVTTPELWVAWTLPRSFDDNEYLLEFTARTLNGSVAEAAMTDEDIADVGCGLQPGKLATMLICQVALQEGTHPERSADHVLNQLVSMWSPASAEDQQAEELFFSSAKLSVVSSMMLAAEYPSARGTQRAELTHFGLDPAMYAREMKALTSLELGKVSDLAHKYLTRDRARTLLVTPISGQDKKGGGTTGLTAADAEGEAELPSDPARVSDVLTPPGVSSFTKTKLENGLELIVGKRAGLPVATVALDLHVTGDRAAAELFQELGRSSAKWSGDPRKFGATFSRSAATDHFRYMLRGAAGNVSDMLAILGARVPNMEVLPETIVEFRRLYIPFLKRSEQRPEEQATRALLKGLFGEHVYGTSVMAADLEAVNGGQIEKFIEATHVPANAVVVVVGEVEPAEVAEQARKAFAGWKSDKPAIPAPIAPVMPSKSDKPLVIVTNKPGATQAELQIGCLLPPAPTAARYDVMAKLIDGRLSKIRMEQGGSYSVQYASIRRLRGGAVSLMMQSAVDNAHAESALGAIKSMLTEFSQGHFKHAEVELAQWGVARRYGVAFLSSEEVASEILRAHDLDLDIGTIDAYPAELGKIRPAFLQLGFVKCLERPVVSAVGDEPALKAAIAKVWP